MRALLFALGFLAMTLWSCQENRTTTRMYESKNCGCIVVEIEHFYDGEMIYTVEYWDNVRQEVDVTNSSAETIEADANMYIEFCQRNH